MSRIERHAVTMPRWALPKLGADQRRDLAMVQLEKLADIHEGLASAETLWDMVRDAFTWARVAELLHAGEAEMAAHLELVTRMVEHYGKTGRVEFTSTAQDQAARLACAWMEDLALIVDRGTALAAARWSEERVDALFGDRTRRAA
jgi:hypothetical protein